MTAVHVITYSKLKKQGFKKYTLPVVTDPVSKKKMVVISEVFKQLPGDPVLVSHFTSHSTNKEKQKRFSFTRLMVSSNTRRSSLCADMPTFKGLCNSLVEAYKDTHPSACKVLLAYAYADSSIASSMVQTEMELKPRRELKKVSVDEMEKSFVSTTSKTFLEGMHKVLLATLKELPSWNFTQASYALKVPRKALIDALVADGLLVRKGSWLRPAATSLAAKVFAEDNSEKTNAKIRSNFLPYLEGIALRHNLL